MELIVQPLTKKEIVDLENKYGVYFKLTVDLENEILVAGCELHADGERLLIKQGGKTENIWGGGVNLKTKKIDATAVLNLRPRLANESMEILDPLKRKKFFQVVRKIFAELWP